MTRYEWKDAKGRPLYRGEIVAGRKYTPASRRGYLGALAVGLVWANIAFWIFDFAWIFAVLAGALVGQVILTRRQRQLSREIWDLAETDTRQSPETEEERRLREEAEARAEKLRHMRISLEAEFPYVDYETGQIFTPAELPEEIAELERQGEARKVIDGMLQELARPVAPEDCGVVWDGDAEDWVPDRPVPGKTVLPEIVRGRPANRSASRRARLSSGEIVELTNDDLGMIRALGGAHFGPDMTVSSPSGIDLTGADLAALAEELRRIERVRTCPHEVPVHEACGQCVIGAGTPAAARVLDESAQRHEERLERAGLGARTAAVVRRDLDQLAGHVRSGKVDAHTANSLRADLIQEWHRRWDQEARDESRRRGEDGS
jgi:hypothetical protein